jgi:tetratricopeptide (TPR) repeat protein
MARAHPYGSFRTPHGRRILVLVVGAAAAWLCGGPLLAQSFRHGTSEFNALRSVLIPPGKTYVVIVTEFFHHGQIAADGHNVLVAAKNKELTPLKILQLGPGDFCRLAFETLRGQTEYDIFYGGPAAEEKSPPWDNHDGLLLETREFQECNFHELESVRQAFASARPIGADYVDYVFHSWNPLTLGQKPFLSHYSGYLQITAPGMFGFWTASQDCSFLLIDDKLVISAPGRHGGEFRAKPGTRGNVRLTAGSHKFDYYHAAGGPAAKMTAAWQPKPPKDEKKSAPAAIPSEVFRTQHVGHLPPSRPMMKNMRLVPDFVMGVGGEVPLPDDPVPLIGVRFLDASSTQRGPETKVLWDFGDGQTANQHKVDHVYLHPGTFAVKLTLQQAGRPVEIVNHVAVDSPNLTEDENKHTLNDYLTVLDGYDPRTLDAAGLLQLMRAFEAKALAIQDRTEEENEKADANEKRMTDEARVTAHAKRLTGASPAALQYLRKAVAAARAAMGFETSAAQGDEDLIRVGRMAGPMARDQLGDSVSAERIWLGVAARLKTAALRAECEAEAADIALNDLGDPPAAKAAFDAAVAHLGQDKSGQTAVNLERTRGDLAAVAGDGPTATAAYREAQRLASAQATDPAGHTARRGAHGRSVEEFLKVGLTDRAAEELHQWQQDAPADKIDGYLTLLLEQYWAARKQFPQALAQVAQLRTVSPDSPYIDQVLYLAADCELKRGHREAAVAILNSIVKDYPGSPLVPRVKETIEQLAKGKKK